MKGVEVRQFDYRGSPVKRGAVIHVNGRWTGRKKEPEEWLVRGIKRTRSEVLRFLRNNSKLVVRRRN